MNNIADCEESDISFYLCADKVYCHNIMNAMRRHETPVSETKK